jgi:hypothetical protein
VEVDLKRINERGAAALQGKVDDTGTTIATAGVRFDKGLKASFQQDSWLHLRGGVGYRRASGDRSQVANLAFANGSTTFAVNGAPIADNAVVAELGLSAWLTRASSWSWATAASSAAKAATTVPMHAGPCVSDLCLQCVKTEGRPIGRPFCLQVIPFQLRRTAPAWPAL